MFNLTHSTGIYFSIFSVHLTITNSLYPFAKFPSSNVIKVLKNYDLFLEFLIPGFSLFIYY